MKRTKIVCTIGPASDKKIMLKKMIKSGMNVARLNFSHNVHAYHGRVIKTIRSAAKELHTPVAIIQDLQGPRIRIGDLPEPVELKDNTEVVLTTGKGGKNKIPVTYKKMHKDLKVGDRILIADGVIELKVTKLDKKDFHCKVVIGGKIVSHKGINLPDTDVQIPALSEKDKKDLLFGIKQGVDFVALSFVRTADEVNGLKTLIKQYAKKVGDKGVDVKVIVKIERREAIDNIDEIIQATDGVMVARGDLGIELPAEDVPLKQKMIIDKCLAASKPVIVATQMLDSMIQNPRPTRAEVSDVANAVIDHTDAVMLSGETAGGLYPVQAVETMKKIIEKTENSTYDDVVIEKTTRKIIPTDEAISSVAKMLSEKVKVKMILVASLSGYTGRMVSRYRPETPIWVACDDARVQRQLYLSWGINPFVLPTCKTLENLVSKSINYLRKGQKLKTGDQIVVLAGAPVGKSGNINMCEIKTVD